MNNTAQHIHRIQLEAHAGDPYACKLWVKESNRLNISPPPLWVYIRQHSGTPDHVSRGMMERFRDARERERGLEEMGAWLRLTLWQWERFRHSMLKSIELERQGKNIRNAPADPVGRCIKAWARDEIMDIQEVREALEETRGETGQIVASYDGLYITAEGSKGVWSVWFESGERGRLTGWYTSPDSAKGPRPPRSNPTRHTHVDSLTQAVFGRVAP